MRITRVYQNTDLALNQTIVLDKNSSHYLAKVMRCSIGDSCHVFNANAQEFKAEIKSLTKNSIELYLTQKIENNTESNLSIHLAQGLCKGDKMDFILQKSVELGVTEITPVFSEYCDVKLNAERIEKKMQHWRKIIISATEQSGRAVLAKLNYPKKIAELLVENTENMDLFLLSPRGELNFKNISDKSLNNTHKKSIKIFIGPEGGFSEKEEKLALKNNIQLLKLGSRILRTETAGLATIAALQSHWGDFYA